MRHFRYDPATYRQEWPTPVAEFAGYRPLSEQIMSATIAGVDLVRGRAADDALYSAEDVKVSEARPMPLNRMSSYDDFHREIQRQKALFDEYKALQKDFAAKNAEREAKSLKDAVAASLASLEAEKKAPPAPPPAE